jgi:hypothetical protein
MESNEKTINKKELEKMQKKLIVAWLKIVSCNFSRELEEVPKMSVSINEFRGHI